jgi:hypothetical protein
MGKAWLVRMHAFPLVVFPSPPEFKHLDLTKLPNNLWSMEVDALVRKHTLKVKCMHRPTHHSSPAAGPGALAARLETEKRAKLAIDRRTLLVGVNW